MPREQKIYVLKHKEIVNLFYFKQLKQIADFAKIPYTKLQKRFYLEGVYIDENFEISVSNFQDGSKTLEDFLQ